MERVDEVAQLRAENQALRAQVTTLLKQVAALQAELTAARADLAAAQQRISDLEQRPPDPPAFVKPNTSPKERQPRRKRDPKHNRARRLEVPTRIVAHALDRCLDCHQRLRGGVPARRRQVIELPEPQPVEVVEHQVIKRWCSWCGRWQAPPLDLRGQVVGQGRVGVRLASLIAYLRTTARLPVRRIRAYLQTMHRLTISIGELAELLHRVRRHTQAALDALKAQARASPVLHADETGWREAGQSGYVWALSTPGADAVRYYEYDRSRAGAVARRLVGGTFTGHLVSDFYGAYNGYAGPHQRCWAHLLRDLERLRDAHAHRPEVVRWIAAVRGLYQGGRAWVQTGPGAAERKRCYGAWVQQAQILGQPYARRNGHPCQALAKRLLRHLEELFQYVRVAGVPADNNQAERSIRPVVVLRKVSGGTQSPEGSKTRLGLASLFETWQARGLNPFDECLTLLRQTPLPQL